MALSEPPRLAWSGRYNDGRTAARYPVDARIGEDGLTIASEDGALRETWPRDEVRLVDGPDAGGAIRLGRRGRDARLTVADGDALRALEMHCPSLHKSLSEESSWRVIAIWSGAAIAAIAFLIFGVIPFIADHAGTWVSPRLEAKLGDQVADFIISFTVAAANKDHAECHSAKGVEALDKLIAPLAAQLSLRNTLRVRVINSDVVNAIALPGDEILVFKGLIDFTRGPNELAGVLGHEMGHLQLDHPTRLVIRESGTAFVIGLVMGDIFGGSAISIAGTGLLVTAFSRDAESAADAEAVTLMRNADLDVAPFGRFFERLQAEKGDGDIPVAFLRTHPPSDQRAKLVEAAPPGGRQALTQSDWQDLKAICNPD
ncbi:MAG TPA: M48 family metallopeptidase [Stellaceae bacterium]|nr:M48 family metallopeptidase [Stellaceae bacterium]